MPMRMLCAALVATLAVITVATPAHAADLDLKRYMPVSEIRPGMTGVGRTTLRGNEILEFQVEVLAVIEKYGPKQDLIICRASGAGLEASGIIAGMSGSPVYLKGRLIGALAYAFSWSKIPICGVQPIEQMLGLASRFDRHPAEPKAATNAPAPAEWMASDPAAAVPVPATALAGAALPADKVGAHGTYQMHPIASPVMVSGLPRRALDDLANALAPYGMVPMAGGGTEADKAADAKLVPGAPLAIPLLRGDITMTTMGTITEMVGNRVYGFGHAMFAAGEANLPLMTGVGKVVIPSLQRSFRMGAPVQEVGRLVWDEETAVLGLLGNERATMVPITVKVAGPGKALERTYACEMAHKRGFSSLLAATAAGAGFIAHSDLPREHTIRYRVRVVPVGHEPIVRENLAVSPNADSYVQAVVRHLVRTTMDNPFENLRLESVEVEATVEPGRRFAEIEKARPLRNAVRPGGTLPVELRIRPWRKEPRWITVSVRIPDDYPEGKYTVVLCGGDEALSQEQREAPAHFHADDLASLLDLVGTERPRDHLHIRLERPGQGIAIGRRQLPNLPPSMRSMLTTSARLPVTPVKQARVTTQPMAWFLQGGRKLTLTVDREAPEH